MRMSISARSGCRSIRPTMFRASICSHSGACRRCAWYWTISYCVVLVELGTHVISAPSLTLMDGVRARRPFTAKCPCATICLFARVGPSKSIDDVVQPCLQDLEQILARRPALPGGDGVVPAELALKHAVNVAGLLLLPQVDAPLREPPSTPVARGGFAGRAATPLNGAFRCIAALSLEKELDSLSPA